MAVPAAIDLVDLALKATTAYQRPDLGARLQQSRRRLADLAHLDVEVTRRRAHLGGHDPGQAAGLGARRAERAVLDPPKVRGRRAGELGEVLPQFLIRS